MGRGTGRTEVELGWGGAGGRRRGRQVDGEGVWNEGESGVRKEVGIRVGEWEGV